MLNGLRSVSVTLVALLGAACATEGTVRPLVLLPAPPGEALRARLERVAVASGRFVPDIEVVGPARGVGEGAKRGAGIGGAASIGGGAATGNPYLAIAGLLLSPVAISAGAVTGAVMARSAGTVESEYAQLASALAQQDMQVCLRDRAAGWATGWTSKTIETLPDRGPEAVDRVTHYGPVDTAEDLAVLEVVVERMAVEGWGVRSPRTSIFVVARTRLLRARDGTELYGHRIAFHSPERPWQQWTAEGALGDELERACDLLAEHIADDVFALYIPSAWRRR